MSWWIKGSFLYCPHDFPETIPQAVKFESVLSWTINMPAFADSAFGRYFVHDSTFSSTPIAWSLPCKSNAKKLVTGCWIVLLRAKSVRDCDGCKRDSWNVYQMSIQIFDLLYWFVLVWYSRCDFCMISDSTFWIVWPLLEAPRLFHFLHLAGGLAKAVKAGTTTGTYRTSTSTFAATNRMGKIQDPWRTNLLPQWDHQPHCHSAMFVETSFNLQQLAPPHHEMRTICCRIQLFLASPGRCRPESQLVSHRLGAPIWQQ